MMLTREGQIARRQPWHPDHAACTGCGTTSRPHHSAGRCTDCVRGKPRPTLVPADESGEKFCRGCQRWKPIHRFHKDRHSPDGLYHRCKRCRRPIQAAVTKRHAETRRAASREYRATHREELNARDRRRYHADVEATREAKREAARRFRERHRERINAEKRAAYAANAELERAAAALRRGRTRATQPQATKEEKAA